MSSQKHELHAMSQMEDALLFAHRTNIDRYRRLLRTSLTEIERNFVQHRLNEEMSAAERLARDFNL